MGKAVDKVTDIFNKDIYTLLLKQIPGKILGSKPRFFFQRLSLFRCQDFSISFQ